MKETAITITEMKNFPDGAKLSATIIASAIPNHANPKTKINNKRKKQNDIAKNGKKFRASVEKLRRITLPTRKWRP